MIALTGEWWQPQEMECPDKAGSTEPEPLPGTRLWIPDAASVDWDSGEPGKRERRKQQNAESRYC